MKLWKTGLILAACAGIVGALENPAHSTESSERTIMNATAIIWATERCGAQYVPFAQATTTTMLDLAVTSIGEAAAKRIAARTMLDLFAGAFSCDEIIGAFPSLIERK